MSSDFDLKSELTPTFANIMDSTERENGRREERNTVEEGRADNRELLP